MIEVDSDDKQRIEYENKLSELTASISKEINRLSLERYIGLPDYLAAEMMVDLFASVADKAAKYAKLRKS